jgi:hypothetical protein
MPMPKGHKSKHGYATVTGTGGRGYREIAETMTAAGSKMNHMTARNHFFRAMNKLAKPLSEVSARPTEELVTDPTFQDAIASLMREKKICFVK